MNAGSSIICEGGVREMKLDGCECRQLKMQEAI
jgi:hypothetical protein